MLKQTQKIHGISKDVLWTVLSVTVIPSVTFWLIGQFLFIDRAIFNIDYMLIGLILIPFGAMAVGLGVTLLLVLDVIFSIAPAYHFSLVSIIDSLRELSSLEPAYLVTEAGKVTSVVLACAALVYLSLKQAQSSRVIAVTCLVSVIIVMFLDVRFSANALAEGEAYTLNTNIAASSVNNLRVALTTADFSEVTQYFSPMESASDLLRESIVPGGDGFQTVILIVVESLGEISNPEVNRFQLEPILALKNQAGLVFNNGVVGFEGSTVPGELRELCRIKYLAVHPDKSVLPSENCLPMMYAGLGYRTLAIHGFIGTVFSRNRWYPALAFDDIWFAPELDARISQARRCGIAFHGICDSDIWEMISEPGFTQTDARQFIYWLTLSAHLPVESPGESMSKTCAPYELLVEYPELCSLVLQQRQFLSAIAIKISQRELNNTRILLVGDHMPPFLDTGIRALFDSKHVPYVDIQIPGNR